MYKPMLQFLRSNKNILVVALGIFTVSMTSLMFFLNTQNHSSEVSHETKANVLDSVMVHSNYNEEKAIRDELGNEDDAVVVIGIDGKINFASWDYEKITGLPPDELEEQLFFSYIHPEDLATIFAVFGDVIESGEESSMVGPYRVLTSGGDYTVNMASLHPLKENDKVTRIAITAKEITQEMLEPSDEPPKALPPKIKPSSTKTTSKTVKHEEENNETETHHDEDIIQAKQSDSSTETQSENEHDSVKTESVQIENESHESTVEHEAKTETEDKEVHETETNTKKKKSGQSGPTLKGYKENEDALRNQEGTPVWLLGDEMAYIDKF